jgi:hypothetical protein
MTLLFLVIKIVVVLFFLIMFLRSDKLVWGIGLLTVTSAILLDTFMATFGRDEMLELLGFFYYVLAGAIFAGAVLWMWTLARPYIQPNKIAGAPQERVANTRIESANWPEIDDEPADTLVERQMLNEQIRDHLSPDDILDLIFDLDWNENDIIRYNQDNDQVIVRLINLASERNQTGNLALAVERILTPIPAENLPRLEKLGVDTPHPVLRYYLIANYSAGELQQISADLQIDWEVIGGDNKKTKVRNFLLYLYRRNRIDELIVLMQADGSKADGTIEPA